MNGVTLYPKMACQVPSSQDAVTWLSTAFKFTHCCTPNVAVVDVYSAWCGPCKAVQGLFRRLKNELGDELLRFALVLPLSHIAACIVFISPSGQIRHH